MFDRNGVYLHALMVVVVILVIVNTYATIRVGSVLVEFFGRNCY